MLADEVLSANVLKPLGKGFERLKRDLHKAHRFDLDANFAAAADELGTTKPSTFEKAISLCRLPYSTTWLELPNSYRERFSDPAKEGTQAIKRIGLFAQQVQDNPSWLAHLVWSFPNGEVNVSMYAVAFDLTDDAVIAKSAGVKNSVELAIGAAKSAKMPWAESTKEIDALMRISGRCIPLPSFYHVEVLQRVEKESGKEAVARALQKSLGNWESEHPFWLGVFALLNSRNASQIEPGPNLEKLNRNRRRSGKQELLTFSTCRIAPKLKARIDAENKSAESLSSSVRAHFVRGHFKVRSSGVFWWSPFLRGDKRMGFASKDYEVIG